jgi:preprotein translocase subunit SecG
MYLFFLMFFIFVSIALIVLILLQPGKGLNNIVNLNTKNNVKFSNNIGTNVIGVFSCFFLIISIILCNINSRKIDSDFFLEDNSNNTVMKKSFSNKQILNSDIPH